MAKLDPDLPDRDDLPPPDAGDLKPVEPPAEKPVDDASDDYELSLAEPGTFTPPTPPATTGSNDGINYGSGSVEEGKPADATDATDQVTGDHAAGGHSATDDYNTGDGSVLGGADDPGVDVTGNGPEFQVINDDAPDEAFDGIYEEKPDDPTPPPPDPDEIPLPDKGGNGDMAFGSGADPSLEKSVDHEEVDGYEPASYAAVEPEKVDFATEAIAVDEPYDPSFDKAEEDVELVDDAPDLLDMVE